MGVGVKKKRKEKVGEADAKKKINRDKREEGGVSDQPFLPYGVPAGTTKEKEKKKKSNKKQKRNPEPGVNASGGGCEWREAGRGEGGPGRFTIVSGSRRGSSGGGRRREEAVAPASAPFAPPDLGRCALSQAREQQQQQRGRHPLQPEPPPCPTRARRTFLGSR